MYLMSFDKRYGCVIGEVNMTNSTFAFDEYNVTPQSHLSIPNPNTPDGEHQITYEYGDDPACKIMCIDTDDELQAFKKIITTLDVNFTDMTPGSNPIIDRYDMWMENWRLTSISTPLEWRDNVNIFQSLRNDTSLQLYLKKIEKLGFIIFDHSDVDAKGAMEREIHKWS